MYTDTGTTNIHLYLMLRAKDHGHTGGLSVYIWMVCCLKAVWYGDSNINGAANEGVRHPAVCHEPCRNGFVSIAAAVAVGPCVSVYRGHPVSFLEFADISGCPTMYMTSQTALCIVWRSALWNAEGGL